MSRAHQEHLERLVRGGRGVIEAFLRGEAPDLPTYDTERDAELTALVRLGDIDPEDAAAPECRTLLRELARTTQALTEHFGRLRDETRDRLVTLDVGRRGLRGYQRALGGAPSPGGRHGRG